MTVSKPITGLAAGAEEPEPVESHQLALSRGIAPEALYRAIRARNELQQMIHEATLNYEETEKMLMEDTPLYQQQPMPIMSTEPGSCSGFTHGSWMNSEQQHPGLQQQVLSSPGVGESASVIESEHLPQKRPYSQMPEVSSSCQQAEQQLKVKSEFGDDCIDDPRRKDPRREVCELRADFKRELDLASRAEPRPRRIDQRVAASMRGRWLNQGSKFVGIVPGVQVGDVFHYRMEMCMVGLHRQPRAGIDVGLVGDQAAVPVAVALVMMVAESVTGYADDQDKGETVIYSGQGTPPEDQKLERGNLGLCNSKKQWTPVRLIRGYRGPSGVLYSYDGLYMVEKMIYEKGVAGNMVYKFELRRMKGQAPLQLLKMPLPLSARLPLSSSQLGGGGAAAAAAAAPCLPVAGGFAELSNGGVQDSSLVKVDRLAATNLPDLNGYEDEDDMEFDMEDFLASRQDDDDDPSPSAADDPKKDDSKTAQEKDPTPAFDVPQTGSSADFAAVSPSRATFHIPSLADASPADFAAASPSRATLHIPSLADGDQPAAAAGQKKTILHIPAVPDVVVPAAAAASAVPASAAASAKKARNFPPLSSLYKDKL